ncbi:MAG: hypothetical protein HQP61_10015 [Peptococcaceae bacterium]|nr:hypothetical protein [Candidatus Syntrophopropionicum ammoniitolerans]
MLDIFCFTLNLPSNFLDETLTGHFELFRQNIAGFLFESENFLSFLEAKIKTVAVIESHGAWIGQVPAVKKNGLEILNSQLYFPCWCLISSFTFS